MKKLIALLLLAATAVAQPITLTKNPNSGVAPNALTSTSKVFVVPDGGSVTATGTGVIIATGGAATSVPWSGVTGTPTTLSGYGITDAVPSSRTVSTSSPLAGGGALSSNLTLSIPAATSSVNGYLTSADWVIFNAKQPAGAYITALTGDVTAAGPGSAAATLASVISASSVGSSTAIPVLTYDAKGRLTSTTTAAVIASAGTLTGTTLASNVVTSSLTTVGTIGSGTWQGAVVAGQYGGTGVANTGKTVTLGGNLTTSGAFGSTFTMTATTAVTFPTTGTLATLAGAEALTNKTVNGLTISTTTGTLTLANGSTLATSGAFSTTFTSTATTALTLPTTGTLVTLAGAEALTNKTVNGLSITTTTGTLALANSSTLTTVGAFASTFTMTGTTSVTFPTSGTLATTAGTVANATNIGITDDVATNATVYPLWVTATTGFLPAKVSSTQLSFNPSTGLLTSTSGMIGGMSMTANSVFFVDSITSTATHTLLLRTGTFGTALQFASATGSATFVADVTGPSYAVNGTGGLGFIDMPIQSSPPATPAASHIRIFNAATNKFAWIGASGNVRTFDGTLTASRVYTLPDADSSIPVFGQTITFAGPTAARTVTFPDASFTVARTDAANTFTGTQTINAITSAALSTLTLGTGTFGTSMTFASATGIPTFATHVVVEGVTSTGATGTGNLVFSASPTLTGTLTAATITANGVISTSNTTASTSTTTGALIVSGGAGIALNVGLALTVDSTTGIILKGGARFLHDFLASGGSGHNLYLGVNAGNFTTTSAAVDNIGIGFTALSVLTSGYNNNALGTQALAAVTSGQNNNAQGYRALLSTTTGIDNTGVGGTAGADLTTGSDNTFVGYNTGRGITTGNNNTVIGGTVGGLASGLTSNIILAIGTGAIKLQFDATDWSSSSTTEATTGGAGSYKFSGGIYAAKAIVSGSTTSSTSTTTGAFLGKSMGLTENLYIGGTLNVTNGAVNFAKNTGGTSLGSGVGPILTNGDTTVGNRAGLYFSDTFASVTYAAYIEVAFADRTNDYGTLDVVTRTAAGIASRIAIDSSGDMTVSGRITASSGLTYAVGKTMSITSGTNQRAGDATLVGGTVTVSNTTVTANTRVLLTRKTSGGTIGTAITYTVSAGTSFTITSDSILDTSTFSYFLLEVP